MRPRTA
jgi:hypothetical protein